MLVIRDDPQIDLLVKIAYGPCWGGTIASEVRKNELGHWEEVCMDEVRMDKFGRSSCPAEVNLSVPGQITVDCPSDEDRRLVALGVRGFFLWGDAAFAGVEISRSFGVGRFFTVLALSSARSGALPGADRGLLDLEWDDSMTRVLSGNTTDSEVLQPVRASANEIVFQDKDGDEVIFERQQYRVAIRRGRSEPITGYLWMVGKDVWAGIELRRRRSRGKKFRGKQPDFLQLGFLRARQ